MRKRAVFEVYKRGALRVVCRIRAERYILRSHTRDKPHNIEGIAPLHEIGIA